MSPVPMTAIVSRSSASRLPGYAADNPKISRIIMRFIRFRPPIIDKARLWGPFTWSAFGHLELWSEYSIGIGRQRQPDFFDWLVLGVIHKIPYGLFRRKSYDHNAFLRFTLKRLRVETADDHFTVVFGDEREDLRNVLLSVSFDVGDCLRQNLVSGHESPPQW